MARRDERRTHDVADLGDARCPGDELHVAARDDAHGLAAGIHHGEPADALLLHQRHGVLDRVRRTQRDRIGDDAVLAALDLGDFARLRRDGHVLVDEADAAFLGQRACHRTFGDRVHRRRDQRDVEADRARELGGRVGAVGGDGTRAGNQEDIVEGDAVLDDLAFHAGISPPRADLSIGPRRTGAQTGCGVARILCYPP
jgi:hypothetical protein